MPIIPRIYDSDYGASALRVELERVAATLKRVRYLRLSHLLMEGENPEINADKKALESRLVQLGFRTEIGEALNELERKLRSATTALGLRDCVDSTRLIYEEIVEDSARSASKATKRSLPPPGARDFVPWKNLLVNAGVLTEEEGDFFQKLYNYLSNVGTHRLGSAPEHVRLTKNVVIEVCLLLVGRLQALSANPASS